MSERPLYPSSPVLLVDDDPGTIRVVELTLRGEGVTNVEKLLDSRLVMAELARRQFSVVALDLSMPNLSGQELLELIKADFPETVVVVVSANYDVETAVDCMRKGAFDYISKSAAGNDLASRLRRAIEHREILDETACLKSSMLSDRLEHPEAFAGIITSDPKTINVLKYVEALAATSLTLLITGETGAGKELLAAAAHQASGRKGDYVPVNVAGLDDNMLSDTLFGHVKGAFTGADKDRAGLVEKAAGGTLFLDEIGDLSLESQVKLLRLLQERKYYPAGSDTAKNSDARIVAATNQDLLAMTMRGTFRKDLYYRLQAHQVNIPPLRERRGDLPSLVAAFVRAAARETNKNVPAIPPEILDVLGSYDFPGNVRELHGMVFNAVGLSKGHSLSLVPIKEAVNGGREVKLAAAPAPGEAFVFPALLPTLKMVDELLVAEALSRANGNKTVAAETLGITRQALQNRLKR